MTECTLTQDDIDDSCLTEFNEGFTAYMFGRFCYDNPYNGVDYEENRELVSYVMWFDGWMSAKDAYPQLEPKDDGQNE